jgi:hypothetical protein
MDLSRGTDTYSTMGTNEWVLSATLITTNAVVMLLIVYSSDHERRKISEDVIAKQFDAIMLQGE